jgi:hypothetical protein
MNALFVGWIITSQKLVRARTMTHAWQHSAIGAWAAAIREILSLRRRSASRLPGNSGKAEEETANVAVIDMRACSAAVSPTANWSPP